MRSIGTTSVKKPSGSKFKNLERNSRGFKVSQDAKRSTSLTWGVIFIFLILITWGASFALGFEFSLKVFFAVGFIAIVLGLRLPFLGLLGIGILSALDPVMRRFLLTDMFLPWNSLNYWLLIVTILAAPFILRLNDPHSRILQAYLLLLSLGLLISPNKYNGMQVILSIVVLFGLLVYFVRAVDDDQSLYWLGIVNGILGAAGGLVFYMQMNNLPYINPNEWSFFPLTALFSICFGYQLTRMDNRNKIILIFLAAINSVWIFLSGSRGSMLIGLCCLFYLMGATPSLWLRLTFVSIAAVLAVWLSTQFEMQQAYSLERLDMTIYAEESLTRITSGRSLIAQAGLNIFQENPFGVGTGGFREESATTGVLSNLKGKPAHSAWVKTLAENGILGIILLTAYVSSFFVVGLRKRRQGLFLIGALVTFSLAAGFISKEFQDINLWFLAAGGTTILHKEEMLSWFDGSSNRFANAKNKRFIRNRRG